MGAGDGGRPQHGDSGKVRPGAGPARNPGERPTVDALRSGRELFPEPPPRATREEYVAFLEGRKRAELPARVQQLREDLPRYERDAALSAEQARLNSHDDMFASYAKEQQAQLDILRARLADAEAGKVEQIGRATRLNSSH